MKCSKCSAEKTIDGFDPEWISPRWMDTSWYHLCRKCHKIWLRIFADIEKKAFLQFLQQD